MKTTGVILLALGVLTLVYAGLAYNKDHMVLRIGSMKVTATEHRNVALPAVAGVIVTIAGGALLALGSRRA